MRSVKNDRVHVSTKKSNLIHLSVMFYGKLLPIHTTNYCHPV